MWLPPRIREAGEVFDFICGDCRLLTGPRCGVVVLAGLAEVPGMFAE
jgi:hypothetical protein